MNLLVLNEPEPYGGVTWWRMYRPLLELAQTCPDISIIWNRGTIGYQDIMQADVVLAFRPSEPSQLAALETVADFGKPIIADFDDDQLNIPFAHGDYQTLGVNAPIVEKCIQLCTQIWVTNKHLADVYQHPNTKVIPNAITEDDLPEGPAPISNCIMYRGSAAYHYDLAPFEDWYQDMLKKAKSFHWVGYAPMWKHNASVTMYNQIPLNEYFRWGRRTGINILWKPMLDIPFCYSKSNIAQLEATMFGGVCLTNFAGTPQWINTLRHLTFDKQRLKATWNASRDEIMDRYRLPRWVEYRANCIREIAFK